MAVSPVSVSNSTSSPTLILVPTATPQPTAPIDPNQVFALNNLDAKQRAGLRLEIARVLIVRKQDLDNSHKHYQDVAWPQLQ
jgi:hypothetical protein